MGGGNIVKIGSNCHLNGMTIFMNSNDNYIEIGNGVIINANKRCSTVFSSCDECAIKIGDNCLFSNSVEVHTTDYHDIFDEDKKRINPPEPVIIGNNCWIGLKVIILKGVNLKQNTVVGAGSVVTKKFTEESVVIAGNPAEIKKHRISWSK